ARQNAFKIEFSIEQEDGHVHAVFLVLLQVVVYLCGRSDIDRLVSIDVGRFSLCLILGERGRATPGAIGSQLDVATYLEVPPKLGSDVECLARNDERIETRGVCKSLLVRHRAGVGLKDALEEHIPLSSFERIGRLIAWNSPDGFSVVTDHTAVGFAIGFELKP